MALIVLMMRLDGSEYTAISNINTSSVDISTVTEVCSLCFMNSFVKLQKRYFNLKKFIIRLINRGKQKEVSIQLLLLFFLHSIQLFWNMKPEKLDLSVATRRIKRAHEINHLQFLWKKKCEAHTSTLTKRIIICDRKYR